MRPSTQLRSGPARTSACGSTSYQEIEHPCQSRGAQSSLLLLWLGERSSIAGQFTLENFPKDRPEFCRSPFKTPISNLDSRK